MDEVWGPGVDPSAAPIAGGITNRNFRVDIQGESFVIRIAGADTDLLGIDRQAEFEAASAAAEAGVAPEVFAFLPERSCLITRFVEGLPVPAEDLERPEIMASVVRSIRAIHGMPALRSRFDVFSVIEDHRGVASERGVEVPANCLDLLGRLEEVRSAFLAAGMPETSCHNDLLNANLIRTDDRVVIVDYEYAGMNNLFFDLGNFSINNDLPEAARRLMLREYFGEVTPQHEARLALMRIASDFREAMWGVAQQALSTLNFDYVAYAGKHFDRLRPSLQDPRYPAWLVAAGEVG